MDGTLGGQRERSRDLRRATRERALLDRLQQAAGSEVVAAAHVALDELLDGCEGRPLEGRRVLLPIGGGRRSLWTLTFVRLMQLMHAARSGETFALEVVVVIHPGMPSGVFPALHRCFRALGIDRGADVRVSATTRDGVVIELEHGSLPEAVVKAYRQEVLLAGHLSQGNGRESFCHTCTLARLGGVARYLAAGRAAEDRVDLVLAGSDWDRIAAGAERVRANVGGLGPGPQASGAASSGVAAVSDAYYAELFGPGVVRAGASHAFLPLSRLSAPPRRVSVSALVAPAPPRFMSEFLGLDPVELELDSLSKSGCFAPRLMVHLRGLLAEFEGRGYVAGVREYLSMVAGLMARAGDDPGVIAGRLAPYERASGIRYEAERAGVYAAQSYGLTRAQLQALVASPLTDRRSRLPAYLRWAYPGQAELLPILDGFFDAVLDTDLNNNYGESAQIELVRRAYLSGGRGKVMAFATACRFVADVLGLSLPNVQRLMRRASVSRPRSPGERPSALEILRDGDPHKIALTGFRGEANRLISGR